MILTGGTKPILNRKNNVQYLIDRFYGTQTAMAVDLKGTELNQSSISNLLLGKSPFWDYKARCIERCVGIPIGWLDEDEWIKQGWKFVLRYRQMNDDEKALFNETVDFMKACIMEPLNRQPLFFEASY
jgi:hypothetical protein